MVRKRIGGFMRRIVFGLVGVLAVLAVGVYLAFGWMIHNPHPAVTLGSGTFAIRDATIYPSPDEAPVEHGSVLVRDGRIVAVGAGVAIPAEAQTLPCDHCVVMAGFWNAHVHFTQAKWALAAFRSTTSLERSLQDMLTSRGFTTVVDTGSNPFDTVSLRRRIETGGVLGPHIYTAGSAQYPPHGIPFYLRESLPKPMLKMMSMPNNPAEAVHDEQVNIARGADVLKLFTGAYVERNDIEPMPLENAAAAVGVAHAHGQLAFTHPSNLKGMLIARDAGVDVLAHAADDTEGVTAEVLQSIVDHDMAMVPTLKMFGTTVTHKAAYLDPIYAEVKQFHALGGELLFGTDVGYMTDYATDDEFDALSRSGLDAMDILRMLTVTPAKRFHVEADKGRVAPGQMADLVILGSDPTEKITNFADVRLTLRGGRILYQRKAAQ